MSYDMFIKSRKQFIEEQLIIQQTDLKHPFIMLENYTQTNKSIYMPNNSIDNLVILVHGYQGSDYDLELARYFIEMYNPHTYCLMSSSLQDNMDESIQYLGVRLSAQIKQHLSHTYNSYKRINFIGYSLGGIVIRESMKYLQEYKQKMNLYITLASPHIGTIDGGNYLIKTGIWYLINFENAKNIKQLHCQYQTNQNQSFILKKLSECDTLTWFEKFIVISSEEDSFVPYNSSRLDEESSSIITKNMCENIVKRLKKLQRVQVWFDVEQETKTIDKILGRKAHIQFLQNKPFLNLIFKIYSKQF